MRLIHFRAVAAVVTCYVLLWVSKNALSVVLYNDYLPNLFDSSHTVFLVLTLIITFVPGCISGLVAGYSGLLHGFIVGVFISIATILFYLLTDTIARLPAIYILWTVGQLIALSTLGGWVGQLLYAVVFRKQTLETVK